MKRHTQTNNLRSLLWMTIAISLFSCSDKKREVSGYAPIYGDPADLLKIELVGPQAVESGGKIFVAGKNLFQVESGKGIHITDISDAAAPQKKAFIRVAGSQEIAVKDGLIYTNNHNDLVILKIEGNQVSVIKRMATSLGPVFNPLLPPEPGAFECPDKTKGVVIGWQKKILINPSCTF